MVDRGATQASVASAAQEALAATAARVRTMPWEMSARSAAKGAPVSRQQLEPKEALAAVADSAV